MAVKVTVYGRADMSQITRARAELDALERKALASSNGFMGAMSRIANSTKRVGESLKTTGDAMTRSLTVPIIAAGVALGKATANAAEDAKAQVILAGALRNNAGATREVITATEDWISKQGELYGITDDQLRPSLSTLVGATKDVQKAQILAGLAMDISAARGVEVEIAAKAVAKAYAGQTSQLTKLVPGINKAAVDSKNFGEIYKSVNGIVGGQAAAAARTNAGAMQRNKVALDEATESLGYAFMPIMTEFNKLLQNQVVPTIQRVSEWFSKLSNDQKNMVVTVALAVAALGPLLSITGRLVTGISALANGMLWFGKHTIAAVGGIQNFVTGLANANAGASAFATPMMRLGGLLRTGIIGMGSMALQAVGLVGALTKAAAAQVGLNIAMSANPLGAIVLAIAAVTAAVIYLWNTNEGFRNFFVGMWNGLVSFVSGVVNRIVGFVRANWPLIIAALTGPVGIAVTWIITHWKQVTTFFQNLPKWFQTIGKQMVDGLLGGIQNAWGSLTGWLGDAVNGVVNGVKDALGIKSPSKVFNEIGHNVGQGMANGIKDEIPHVANVSREMAIAARKAAAEESKRRYISAWEARYTGVNPSAFDPNEMFPFIAPKSKKKIETGISETVNKIKEGARLAKDAMKAWSMDDVVKPVTTSFAQMLSALQSQVQATADFMNNIAKLKARGLAAGAVASILGMGAAQGGSFASALAGASNAELKQYNAAYNEQSRLTGILGMEQSGAKSIRTVTIAPGAIQVSVSGNAEPADVTGAMQKAIDQLVRELRSA